MSLDSLSDETRFSIPMPSTRTDAVYAFLKKQIVERVLAPGSKLVISQIARQAGVSPIPVREALRRLQADGLVHNNPHVGMTVTRADPVQVISDYRIVAVLAGLAARLAAPNLTDADHAEMERCVLEIDRCIREGRLAEADPYNVGYHDVISARCGNARLEALVTEVWLHNIQRYRLGFGFGFLPGRAESANREHRAILAALRARDCEAAEGLMREHFWLSADLRIQYFAERPREAPPEWIEAEAPTP